MDEQMMSEYHEMIQAREDFESNLSEELESLREEYYDSIREMNRRIDELETMVRFRSDTTRTA